MNCRHRAFVSGVHCLHHIKCFLTPTLANNNAIRAHAQCILHQLSLSYFTLAFEICRTRFQTANMWQLQLQFGGILDRDKPFYF